MLDDTTMIDAVAQRHPLSTAPSFRACAEGATLAEIVAGFDLDPRYGVPRVELIRAGEVVPIPLDWWGRVRPKAGTRVEISYVVEDPATLAALATAALGSSAGTIATAAFGITAASAPLLFSVATAAITVVGGLLISALIPPPEQPGQGPQNFAITGVRNAENRYGIYPKVLGRHRMFPPKTARGYTETIDDEIYYRGRMTFGWGPVALEDLRIGTTPITDFDSVEVEFLNVDETETLANMPALADITKAWRTGTEVMTLCPDDVVEDTYNVKLDQSEPMSRVTRERTESAVIDITFPQGISSRGKNTGTMYGKDVGFRYRWRPLGGTWSAYEAIERRGKSSTLIRWSHRFDFPAPGEYEVEVERTTDSEGDSDDIFDSYLTAVRSFRSGQLPSHEGIAEVAVRIKATDQLNGQVDTLNAIVQQMAPVWDGSAWSAPQPVRHPAWVYLDALRGSHLRRPVEAARCDLGALKAWADEEPHWTCDYVVDTPSRVADVLDIVAAAGRAKRALTDLRYSVIRDGAAGPIRQVLTPRNSWGFKGKVSFPRQLHAFRCLVRSERLEWEQDEVIVYADGYSSSTATEFETLELPGVVVTSDDEDEGNAWRLGRYHLAQAKLRPESFELFVDWEHLRVTRGDKVQVVHDVPSIGIGAARISAIDADGPTLNSVTLDETFDVADPCRLTVRGADGLLRSFTATGDGRVWTRTTGVVDAADLEVGDLVAVELAAQETMEGLITGIYPDADASARITFVPAAPAVLDADTGTIPDYAPVITTQNPFGPEPPAVDRVVSGNAVAIVTPGDSLQPRLSVVLSNRVSPGSMVRAQLRWKLEDSTGWAYGPTEPASGNLMTGPLRAGESYILEAQTLDAEGRSQGWTRLGTYTAEARDFDYVAPPGWVGVAGATSVQLIGEPYPLRDFQEFLVYGATSGSTALNLVGRTAKPHFTYQGPYVRFRVTAVDSTGVESPASGWINVVPTGVTSGDLASDVTQEIDQAQAEAENAASDAAAAEAKAQAVRDAHDGLVGDFVGNLPDAFEAVGDDIDTAAELTLDLAVGAASQAGLSIVSSQFLDKGWNGFQTAPMRVDNELHPVGDTLAWDIGANVNAGASMSYLSSNWVSHPGADAYVIEVEYTLVSGSLDGAGIMFDWNTPDDEFRAQKSLAGMTSGTVELGRPMVGRAVFKRPADFTGTFEDHDAWIIASYPSLGTRAAKHLRVHRLNIRVATAEEVGGGEVYSTITEYAYAKADVDGAVALLRSDLEAEISDSEVELAGYIEEIRGVDIDALSGTAMGVLLTHLGVQADGTPATIIAQGTAIADLEGNASAGYLIKAQAGGQVSLLDLIAADGSGGAVSVARLQASLILLDGTVTTQQLSVGFGKNLLADTSFAAGLESWALFQNGAAGGECTLSVRAPGDTFAGTDFPTLMVLQNGTEQSGYADVRCWPIINADGDHAYGINVEPGKWYQASVKLSMHRAVGEVRIQFYDKDGGTVTYTSKTDVPAFQGSSTNPDDWPTYASLVWQAPAGSVRATIHLRKRATNVGASPANSYMFIHKPQLAETVENATELVPYDVGMSTLITGSGIVADSITVRHLVADVFSANNITAGTMSIKRVTVDETLSLDAENAGFAAGKLSAFDTADGIYFGRTVDENGDPGFGFSMSREAPSGNVESIKATSEGLQITNAQHFRELAEVAAPVSLVTTQTWSIPGGTETIDLQIMGAGGGGAGGDADDNQPNSNGADGGSTIVNLYDGVTLIKTWTSPGAEGGRASSGNSYGNNGVGSQWGSGGAGGIGGHFEQYDYGGGGPYVPPTAGSDATGYGAGGGGGGAEATGDEGGRGGKASQIVSVQGYDVSGLSDPKLTIVIGAGGAGGPGHNGLDKPGGDGSPGRVDVVAVGTRPTRADVIPLTPQFTGTMSSHGPFPDHGSGLWVINCPSSDNLGLGNFEINDSGEVIFGDLGNVVSFVSSKTPVLQSTHSYSRTLRYQFFKMGD